MKIWITIAIIFTISTLGWAQQHSPPEEQLQYNNINTTGVGAIVGVGAIMLSKLGDLSKITAADLQRVESKLPEKLQKAKETCDKALFCQGLRQTCNKSNLRVNTSERCQQFSTCLRSAKVTANNCEYKFYQNEQGAACLFTMRLVGNYGCPGNSSFYKSTLGNLKELDCFDFIKNFDNAQVTFLQSQAKYLQYAKALNVAPKSELAELKNECSGPHRIDQLTALGLPDPGGPLVEEDLSPAQQLAAKEIQQKGSAASPVEVKNKSSSSMASIPKAEVATPD
ncbi:MAG: hypothetical protein WCG27_01570 [Pseudomonadota bacterium]